MLTVPRREGIAFTLLGIKVVIFNEYGHRQGACNYYTNGPRSRNNGKLIFAGYNHIDCGTRLSHVVREGDVQFLRDLWIQIGETRGDSVKSRVTQILRFKRKREYYGEADFIQALSEDHELVQEPGEVAVESPATKY